MADPYDALLDLIGDARFVLIGDATHGTHEFYRERAQITKRLIREKGFGAVAIAADWPDAYRVNRYVRGRGNDVEAVDALGDFKRFPSWMWRNADVLEFVGWLRGHNDSLRPEAPKVGFYGLDRYGFHASVEAILAYLGKLDPQAANLARQQYACFDMYSGDALAYGYDPGLHIGQQCENDLVAQLVSLRRGVGEDVIKHGHGQLVGDDFFYALQNEKLIHEADDYYRAMYRGDFDSWNRRDRHMAETFEALVGFLTGEGPAAKVVVWAHNSHVGDARARGAGARGQTNLSQRLRERYRHNTILIGCTTYEGTVTAASTWDAPSERFHLPPAMEGSYEALLHHAGLGRSVCLLRDALRRNGLGEPHLQRTIGAIYRSDTDRTSHYRRSCLTSQFDAVLYFDRTRAVEPLEPTADWRRSEPPHDL